MSCGGLEHEFQLQKYFWTFIQNDKCLLAITDFYI